MTLVGHGAAAAWGACPEVGDGGEGASPVRMAGQAELPAERHVGNLSSTYLLARTDLTDEQKLQVALCRRQCWIRAAQAGPLCALAAYSSAVVYDAVAAQKLPRNSRTLALFTGGIIGATLGSYMGGKEGAPMMTAALATRPRVTPDGARPITAPAERPC